MVLARSSGAPGSGGIVQSTGAVFEGESGRRYAGSLEAVVNATAGAVATDELKLMRIRTKRHELIITPGGLTCAAVLTPRRPLPPRRTAGSRAVVRRHLLVAQTSHRHCTRLPRLARSEPCVVIPQIQLKYPGPTADLSTTSPPT
ncbi:hypothetical protein VHUM_02541 [Vanrija humicola]|uniref:Roadblock/LAMTOR2 domain-containing protein n=1 Tax=Vanrija humicola TaxID=5417 RepID=A0A7D8ZN40_VANHU|nr:hypothetical protein VHUM_02541 [Vanrija humicola]